MSHPFELELSDLKAIELDIEERLTPEEAAQIRGGLTIYITEKRGEEGGFPPELNPLPKPPIATTMAIGEEGGDIYPVL